MEFSKIFKYLINGVTSLSKIYNVDNKYYLYYKKYEIEMSPQIINISIVTSNNEKWFIKYYDIEETEYKEIKNLFENKIKQLTNFEKDEFEKEINRKERTIRFDQNNIPVNANQ